MAQWANVASKAKPHVGLYFDRGSAFRPACRPGRLGPKVRQELEHGNCRFLLATFLARRRSSPVAQQTYELPAGCRQAQYSGLLDRARRSGSTYKESLPARADASGISIGLILGFGPHTKARKRIMNPTRRDFLKSSLATG